MNRTLMEGQNSSVVTKVSRYVSDSGNYSCHKLVVVAEFVDIVNAFSPWSYVW